MQRGGTQNTSNSIPSCCTASAGSLFISDYVIKLGIESGIANTFDG